jgi:hypothetical protein
MRLHRLRVANFAGIRDAEVNFGPGLNVLYGPNDLGKSTLVAAIRLGLLLPHTSTHCDEYVAWTGAANPIVEMTFETEAQRIWRVRKLFGKSGSSLLQESKNGQDFDDVERGRKVDAKLREILRWGIPEPGGAGGGKGLPTSFLATVLLSTQSDVSAVLGESLQNDPTGSGKDQIAAALQAVAQDPLFIALLRNTQARRDEGYTDKGSKKTAKGSVFKTAAERLNDARDEKERLQRIVADSEGAERSVRELTVDRVRKQDDLTVATEGLRTLERLILETNNLAAAAEQVRLAQQEVLRIRRIGADVDETEHKVQELLRNVAEAERVLQLARSEDTAAEAALESATEAARAEAPGSAVTDTVIRQQLELRKAAAEQAANEAQQRIEAATAAQRAQDAVAAAETDLRNQQAIADSSRESALKAAARVKAGENELRRCDLLERALDVRDADNRAREAQAAVDSEETLRTLLEAGSRERDALARQRGGVVVPLTGALAPMRRLATELATARGALEVGLVVTVSPNAALDLSVRRDGAAAALTSATEPFEIEARSEITIAIADVATVLVRGGRRDAQEKAQALESRWSREVAPHLVAAEVTDLDGLDAKIAEARELDTGLRARDAELESLRSRLGALSGAADGLLAASLRAESCRASLGDTPFDTLAVDLATLGADPIAGLRKRRQQASTEVDTARVVASQADIALTLADERTRRARLTLDQAASKRDVALATLVQGIAPALAAAKVALSAAVVELEKVAAESASLERESKARRERIETAVIDAETIADQARSAVEAAQLRLTTAITGHASQEGRLIELQRLRDAENLAAAERSSSEAMERHAALPVPARIVTDDEFTAAQRAVAISKSELEVIERDIQRAHGALQQVGGAVARERLRDATEAFEMAERQEREVEAEYEAWKLLLEQMKEADAAQASNLGQALAPAIASRFQALTQRPYQTVQLTAQLGTEGIVIAGAVRPTDRISVGTREQLSTLYRLSLAEYLRTVIVLDDQLVQSDDTRMDWFRSMLGEKARSFQIVVFTCRPGDYLAPKSRVPKGTTVHADTDGGFIRAIDLGRVLLRR